MPEPDQKLAIDQFRNQATKLVEQELKEKYIKAPSHITLGKKHWNDVWKRMQSLSSRVQIYDHPMRFQAILDYLWQSYAELTEQTNHILAAYGEKGKEIVHSDEYESDEEPTPPPLISGRVARAQPTITASHTAANHAPVARPLSQQATASKLPPVPPPQGLHHRAARAAQPTTIEIRTPTAIVKKSQTGWSKPRHAIRTQATAIQAGHSDPFKLPPGKVRNISNNPYTYINPNMLHKHKHLLPPHQRGLVASQNLSAGQQNSPQVPLPPASGRVPNSINTAQNPNSTPGATASPTTGAFGPPGSYVNPRHQSINNQHGNITFHNPNFIPRRPEEVGVKLRGRTTLRLRGKLVDISSSSEDDSSDSDSDSDDSVSAGNKNNNFSLHSSSNNKPANRTSIIDSITSLKWQEYMEDPDFKSPVQKVEVDTESLTPFILAAKEYYETSHDEELLDELLALIERNQHSKEILVEGWMADLYIDFLGSNNKTLDVKKFYRKREMEKIKNVMSQMDVGLGKAIEAADIGDVKQLIKQIASGETPNVKRKPSRPDVDYSAEPKFNLDNDSDSEIDDDNDHIANEPMLLDDDGYENLDYGKNVERPSDYSDSDSDDELLLTAEDVLKETHLLRKETRKRMTKQQADKISQSRKVAAVNSSGTKNVVSKLRGLDSLFESSGLYEKISSNSHNNNNNNTKLSIADTLKNMKSTIEGGILIPPPNVNSDNEDENTALLLKTKLNKSLKSNLKRRAASGGAASTIKDRASAAAGAAISASVTALKPGDKPGTNLKANSLSADQLNLIDQAESSNNNQQLAAGQKIPKSLKLRQLKRERQKDLTENLLANDQNNGKVVKPVVPVKRTRLLAERPVYQPRKALEFREKLERLALKSLTKDQRKTLKATNPEKYALLRADKKKRKQEKKERKENKKNRKTNKEKEDKSFSKERRKVLLTDRGIKDSKRELTVQTNLQASKDKLTKSKRISDWLDSQSKTNRDIRMEVNKTQQQLNTALSLKSLTSANGNSKQNSNKKLKKEEKNGKKLKASKQHQKHQQQHQIIAMAMASDRAMVDRVQLTDLKNTSSSDRRKAVTEMLASVKDISLKGGVLIDKKPEWDKEETPFYSLQPEQIADYIDQPDRKRFLIEQMEKVVQGRKVANYDDIEF